MQEGLRKFGHQNCFGVHLKQSVTLKMDLVQPSETLEQTPTTWCKNAKNNRHLNNNHHEGLKTYNSLSYW
jgi:hypothetical protein